VSFVLFQPLSERAFVMGDSDFQVPEAHRQKVSYYVVNGTNTADVKRVLDDIFIFERALILDASKGTTGDVGL
jgi:hypothetical protein